MSTMTGAAEKARLLGLLHVRWASLAGLGSRYGREHATPVCTSTMDNAKSCQVRQSNVPGHVTIFSHYCWLEHEHVEL